MSRYWNEFPRYEQPDAGELRRKSDASKKKAQSRGKILEPVQVQGRNIAKTWWGKAWCDNLERYADYESRLGRGKRYVRNGSVIDLKIQKGKILARVQGSRKTPYKVEIGSVRCLRKNVRISFQDAERNWKIWRRCLEGIFRMK